MGRAEEYLRNAEAAQDWANKSTNREDRERWLGLARAWLELFRSMARPEAPRSSGAPSSKQPVNRGRPKPDWPKSDRPERRGR